MDDTVPRPANGMLKLEEVAVELAREFVQRRPLAALTCAVGCGLLLDSLSSPEERRVNRARVATLVKTAIAEHPELAQALEQAEELLRSDVEKMKYQDPELNNGRDGGATEIPPSGCEGGRQDGVETKQRS